MSFTGQSEVFETTYFTRIISSLNPNPIENFREKGCPRVLTCLKYIAQSYEVQLATKAYQNLDWIELNFNYLDSYMNYSNKQKYSKSNRKEHLDSY